MANQGENNTKLGVFVIAGLLLLILSFYMVGNNHNIFGGDFKLKSRFSNLNGLMVGNNVLFSGFQAGTVEKINLINDTAIEVVLTIDDKVRTYIHKNAMASISTEGLMGNKIVNIIPVQGASDQVQQGDLLAAQKAVSTDEILQTLSKTTNNVAVISEVLKRTILRVDSSALLKLFNDKTIGMRVRSSLANVNEATVNANNITKGLNEIVGQIKKGKGAAGVLLTDTAFAGNLKVAMEKVKSASENANKMTVQLNSMVKEITLELSSGKGSLTALLKDSVMAKNLSRSMDNIQKGTDNFNQDMEALKHNFLFSGYFKRLEKQKKKESQTSK